MIHPFLSNDTDLTELIGHGQSGNSFYYKTLLLHRSLQKALDSTRSEGTRLLPLTGLEFFYPDAPFPAIHGHDDESWTWGFGDIQYGHITCLDQTIRYIMDLLNQHGPFVGIIGFSAGAAIAAVISSLLERNDRCSMFSFEVIKTIPRIWRIFLTCSPEPSSTTSVRCWIQRI